MPADNMDNMIKATDIPSQVIPADEKHELNPQAHAAPPVIVASKSVKPNPGYFYDQGEADEDGHIGQEGDEWPTEEDLNTLRRVPDKISLAVYTVAIIELCERFSYYGTAVLCRFFTISICHMRRFDGLSLINIHPRITSILVNVHARLVSTDQYKSPANLYRSHQLRSETSATWIYNRCRWSRWPSWSLKHGPESIHRHRNI